MHRSSLLALLLLAACTAPSDDDSAAAMDDDDSSITDDDDDATPDDTVYAEVAGVVVDPEGQPLVDLPMTLCGSFCVFASSDSGGAFHFSRAPEGVAVLENLSAPGDDDAHWSKFFDLVTVGPEESVTLGAPAIVPRTPSPVMEPSGPQDLDLDGGLRLSFDADAPTLPFGIEQLSVGAVELPLDQLPRGGRGDWTVLRGWALSLWDTEQEDGFAVEAPLPDPLAPGTEVAFLVADYIYGVETGELRVEAATLSDDGARISTPDDGGIDRLTLLLAAARLP